MSVNLGESRSELLQWLNDLLDLNFTKVEQCGTGAVYCQIIDSIYGDVPMAKVKYTVQYDYEYLQNYKVLQSAFSKHGITKVIPVEKLSKCRLQDNLEFLQWLKRYWVEHKDESPYDPNSRRKALPKSANPSRAGSSMKTTRPASKASSLSSVNNPKTPPSKTSMRQKAIKATPTARSNTNGSTTHSSSNSNTKTRLFSGSSSTPTINAPIRPKAGASAQQLKIQKELELELDETKEQFNKVNKELDEYKAAAEGLETERNFYFNKLRDIEILSQAITDQLSEEAEKQHQQQLQGDLSTDILKNNQSLIEFVEKIQDILYSTEEGFQVPDQIDDDDDDDDDDEEEEGEEEEPYLSENEVDQREIGDDESF